MAVQVRFSISFVNVIARIILPKQSSPCQYNLDCFGLDIDFPDHSIYTRAWRFSLDRRVNLNNKSLMFIHFASAVFCILSSFV